MTADWTAVIIEDDPDVRDLIDIVLTQSGFRTVLAEDGPSGVEAVRRHDPLITTLDVNMPGMDGFAVAKRLRDFSNTYLIMITALADEIDVVQGFEAGADDYLVKPFRPRELRARADSMLRRPRERLDQPVSRHAAAVVEPVPSEPASWAAQAARDLQEQAMPPRSTVPVPVPAREPGQHAARLHAGAGVETAEPPVPVVLEEPAGASAEGAWVHFNGLALNNETRTVTVDGAGVELTRTEFDLLASLLGTGRRVRSKADLVLTMRGQQYVTSYFVNEADKRSVEVHIANLRRKIGDDSTNPRYVETVRGVGYRLAQPQ